MTAVATILAQAIAPGLSRGSTLCQGLRLTGLDVFQTVDDDDFQTEKRRPGLSRGSTLCQGLRLNGLDEFPTEIDSDFRTKKRRPDLCYLQIHIHIFLLNLLRKDFL